jgi:hydroxymethylbilane synthase
MPPSLSRLLRIGTRGSRLAQVQADIVRDALAEHGVRSETVLVKTSGDRIQDRALADAGGKGLFTKELEEALLADEIDLAVHSMKDVPSFLPRGLALAAVLPREAVEDALITRDGAASFAGLPAGARVGTSSVRRAAQLKKTRADLEPVLLRGNVDTRLAKLDGGNFDAIILAAAGLNRLRLADRITSILSADEWLPSPAQGAIGIEIRGGDEQTRQTIGPLNHAATATAIACERGFLKALDGSCRTPIAALATLEGDVLHFRGEVLAPDGSDSAATEFTSRLSALDDAEGLGFKAGRDLYPRARQWLDL